MHTNVILTNKRRSAQAQSNYTNTKLKAGARELFFDWGVKIVRATFRGVYKSVINANKKHAQT